jgi:hypothetical protein
MKDNCVTSTKLPALKAISRLALKTCKGSSTHSKGVKVFAKDGSSVVTSRCIEAEGTIKSGKNYPSDLDYLPGGL